MFRSRRAVLVLAIVFLCVGTMPLVAQGKVTKPLDKIQVLNIAYTEPRQLDPNDAAYFADNQILSMTQEGLARTFVNDKGIDEVVPAGAQRWELSKDGLTVTFYLRNNTWSDGKPVVAQHYVDSIRRLLTPEKAYAYAFLAFDIKNAEEYYNKKAKAEDIGVVAKDAKTLVVTLKNATTPFLKKIAYTPLFPIRLDVIGKGGETWAIEPSKQVYCGPFVVKEWVKQSSMTLEKNPKYWDAANVHLTTVNMKIVAELATRAQLFEAKQMDVIRASGDYFTKWEKDAKAGKFQMYKTPMANCQILLFNQLTGGPSGLMNNTKIRKALSLAINRQEFVETIYGINKPAYGFFPPGLPLGSSEYRNVVPEPLKAEALAMVDDTAKLQAMFKEGLKELGKSDDLKSVKLLYLGFGVDSVEKAKQEYFKQSWEEKLGISVEFKIYADAKSSRPDRLAGKFDITWNSWTGDYADPMTFADLWASKIGYFAVNYGYQNAKAYDVIFDKLATEQDMKKRTQIFADLEKQVVVTDAAFIPYMYLDVCNFMQNYVNNIHVPMFGPQIDFSRAYISGKK